MIYEDMDTKVSFFYGKKCIVNKIRNGGIYLIDLKGNVNPEFGIGYFFGAQRYKNIRYNYAKRKKRFNVNTAFEERRKDIRLLTDDIRL